MTYTHPDSMRGHVAIVTGAAQGVGKGIAAALLERGAAVLAVDIQDEALSATTAELESVGRVEKLTDGVKLWKQFAPDDYAKAVARVPMKRIGNVRTDVGALVAFLLSTDATFITGQTIQVDGGIGCFR